MNSYMLFLVYFFVCLQITCGSASTPLPLPHTEISPLTRAEGDARLEDHSPQIYKHYVNWTYDAYKAAFLNEDKKAWEKKGFACLNPHAKTFGGLGNILIGMLGIQFFAVSIGRPAVINNALLTDMFEHPDPRQRLAPLTNLLLNKEMKSKIKGFAASALAPTAKVPSRFENVKFIGSHGVPTMATGFRSFSPFIPRLLPRGMQLKTEETKFYHNLMCQGFASWLMSRPTKRMEDALTKYKDNFINKCDSKNIPDVAIQVRTEDNINSEFSSPLQNCYIACSVAKARQVQKELQRDICIFVTSNRVSTTDSVVESLNAILNPPNSTSESSPSFKFLYHQMESESASKSAIMHSGKLVEAGRHVESFPPSEDFSLKDDMMDWFLLGEAVHVIGSVGSTFLSTARLRVGNTADRHIFNPLQHDVSPQLGEKTNFKCQCELHAKSCM